MNQTIDLSVIIPVTERFHNIERVYHAYKRGVEEAGLAHEFVYVIDGEFPFVLETLQNLKAAGEPIRIVTFSKRFGETTALNAAFSNSTGEIILTLPAYQQISAQEIPRLIDALKDHDMVVAKRWPRIDSRFNMLQSKLFHLPLKELGLELFRTRRAKSF